MSRTALILLVLVGIGGTQGCGIVTEPDATLELGFIAGYDEGDPQVQVPGVASAGEPFTISVTSYGPSSCWSRARTDVELAGAKVIVSPIDRRTTATNCADVLGIFQHSASVTFSEPGPAEVVVRGRSAPGGKEVEFSFAVEVMP